MPGIARRRRQPRSWSAARRSTRPAATSRAARISASARVGARSKDSSRAGASAGDARPRGGTSRRPVSRAARPQRARRSARWIAAARSNSISCSVIAHASASNGSGRRRTRSRGSRAHRAADQRVEAEALVERAQVVVDAEREAHPLDRLARPRPVVGRGAEHARGRAAGWATRTTTGSPSDVQQARRARRRAQRSTPSMPALRAAAGTATRGRTSTRDLRRRRTPERRSAPVDEVDVDEERAAWPTTSTPRRAAAARAAAGRGRRACGRARRAPARRGRRPATKPAPRRPRRPARRGRSRAALASARAVAHDDAVDDRRRSRGVGSRARSLGQAIAAASTRGSGSGGLADPRSRASRS